MEIKIYYEDTDCGNVVYYANYLRYMERGRTEYLSECGVPVKDLMTQGVFFTVNRVEVDYKSSARYGDTLVIETRLPEVSAASLLFEHVMKDKATGRLLVECKARLVCVGADMKPKRIPKDVAERLHGK
jgi:acyl-CoA thioester hydrolase